MDMMIEDAIKESDMWEINNPRVHALLRNLMVFIDHSDNISDNILVDFNEIIQLNNLTIVFNYLD